MKRNEIAITIGGDAGQGIHSSAERLARALCRGGLRVFGILDYRSRIRGGHNFFQVRVTGGPVFCYAERADLLVALTRDTIGEHLDKLNRGGAVIYDESFDTGAFNLKRRGITAVPIPLIRIAEEKGSGKLMANSVSLGVVCALTGFPLNLLEDILRENLVPKGEDVAESNISAARGGFEYAGKYRDTFPFELTPTLSREMMIIDGNRAFAFGALVGGCKFISAYPMTPATSILEFMAKKAVSYSLIALQTEDEIAAVNMAIGASHAGVRAMTATSGGGFSLMVESLGLAAITETPLVIVISQRPGPSTGLPTRTGQEDLQFVLGASHGEFPRIVLAPGTPEQCFTIAYRAFNLADRYQCPVIVLLDNFLSNSLRSVDCADINLDDFSVDRGELLAGSTPELKTQQYRRHMFTRSGISPRAVPGNPNAVYTTTSDEHDESGNIEEGIENRNRMMEKRMRKLKGAAGDLDNPRLYGHRNADITFVGWGSSSCPTMETVQKLKAEGVKSNFLHLVNIWPFPVKAVERVLGKAKKIVVVEGNYTGQLTALIKAQTCIPITRSVLKYDGRPLSSEFILSGIRDL